MKYEHLSLYLNHCQLSNEYNQVLTLYNLVYNDIANYELGTIYGNIKIKLQRYSKNLIKFIISFDKSFMYFIVNLNWVHFKLHKANLTIASADQVYYITSSKDNNIFSFTIDEKIVDDNKDYQNLYVSDSCKQFIKKLILVKLKLISTHLILEMETT